MALLFRNATRSTGWAGRQRRRAGRPEGERAGAGPASAPAGGQRQRRQRPRLGTAGRLAAFHALVIATVLGVVAIQFTRAFASRYLTTITSDLVENVTTFSAGASSRPAGQSLAVYTRSFLADHGAHGDLMAVSIPSQGVDLGTAGSRALAELPAVASALKRPPPRTEVLHVTLNGSSQEVMAAPIIQSGRTIGTFVTSGSMLGYERASSWALRLAVGEGLVTVLAATASVYLILRRLLGSVQRLTRTARDVVEQGDLSLRVSATRSADEVGEMAATFDAMIERIDDAMVAQRQLLADVSHQLRSPLTVMRGHLEVMTRGPLIDPAELRATTAMVVEVLDHMRSMVEQLLLLGRSLEVDFADVVPVDLRSLVVDVAVSAEVLAPRVWSVGPIPDVVLHADLDKVRGALLNLVDNAVKATTPADTICLSARLSVAPPASLADGAARAPAGPAGWVEIVVEDTGPGIAVEQRAAAMARFSRGPANYEHGTGLGLAIVAAVAKAHGGTVVLDDSPLGGLRAGLCLPLMGRHRSPARPIAVDDPCAS